MLHLVFASQTLVPELIHFGYANGLNHKLTKLDGFTSLKKTQKGYHQASLTTCAIVNRFLSTLYEHISFIPFSNQKLIQIFFKIELPEFLLLIQFKGTWLVKLP